MSIKKSLPSLFLILLFIGSSYAVTSLSSIRSLYTGTPIALPIGTTITGTVISDRSTINVPNQNVIIQDNTGGMVVRFDFISPFNLNENITVDVSGDTLKEFNGTLEIDNVLLTGASVTGTGSVTPQLVTIADILNNMSGTADTWESTLVTINNATITNNTSAVFGGSDTLHDGTGSLVLFTRSLATFASSTYPTGLVNITGYISDFNGLPELMIRGLNDVQIVSSVTDQTKPAAGISVSPNPANGNVTITLPDGKNKGVVNIYNAKAQLVYTVSALEKINISTNNFAAGIYTVQLQTAGTVETQKLIISK